MRDEEVRIVRAWPAEEFDFAPRRREIEKASSGMLLAVFETRTATVSLGGAR